MMSDWKPFKVVEAGEFRNDSGEMEKFFYVVLEVPGFQTLEQFEGTLEECEEECNALNQRINASLANEIASLNALVEELPDHHRNGPPGKSYSARLEQLTKLNEKNERS